MSDDDRRFRFLIYGLGGGMGHAVRSLALARQLADQHCVCLIINTPFHRTISRWNELDLRSRGIRLVTLSPEYNQSQCGECLDAEFRSFEPTHLIVDTFPRGLGGELVSLFEKWGRIHRTLINRCLPTEYIEKMDLRRFVAKHFDCVIVPGETGWGQQSLPVGDRPPVLCRTDPFLVRDANELPTRIDAAMLLGTQPTDKTILIVGSGSDEDCDEMARFGECVMTASRDDSRLRDVCFRFASPFDDSKPRRGDWLRHFPLIETMPAVQGVIGFGGYNLFTESQALKVPSYLVPRDRRYDNQKARLGASSRELRLDEALAWVAARCNDAIRCTGVTYENGAKQAAHFLSAGS